ncbi:MAG: 23S rRNA (pseudouridine(1915)-N(3))-methyltransferase RlmH [Magnetococcales bacterium]|nr:23S rRNA (pseudouridine(1915)-N(3))-methyltransferase RlmH [Magnetococcales bacterium]
MKLLILAVGRGMPAPVRELVRDYQQRLGRFQPVELIEVAEAKRDPAEKNPARALGDEALRLRRLLPKAATIIPLDSRGDTLSSTELAQRMQRLREASIREVCFLIGGPDGLDPELLGLGSWRLSFGPMTFPHMLMRVLLLEQLFRAATILQGVPYHR